MNGKRSFSQMLKEIIPAISLSYPFDEDLKAWLTEELAKHYRPSRFQDRGSEYMEMAIYRHMLWISRYGWTALSHHDELTGRGVKIMANKTVIIGDVVEHNWNVGSLSHLLG